MSGTTIAKRPQRFVANISNPRIAVKLGEDGFAHQMHEYVRLFADTDLYSAKQPNYEVWGPGVAKLCKALGARVTPLTASPDPVTGTMKQGFRCTYDETSGVLIKVEQDVLLECRHPKTGSPIHILATGEVDVWHAYLADMAKLAGNREDVAAIITDKTKAAMEDDGKHDTWVFYPYSFGTWLALNVSKPAVQDNQRKLREMARPDKVRGFATSKGARLALKQANLVPMRFTRGSFLEDAAGRQFIDVPVVCWVAYDSRERMQAAIDDMLARQGDALDATWEVVADDKDPFAQKEDGEPEREALADSVPAIEQDDSLHEDAIPAERPREKVETEPDTSDRVQDEQKSRPSPSQPDTSTNSREQLITEIERAVGDDDATLHAVLDAFQLDALGKADEAALRDILAEIRDMLGGGAA